MSEALGVFKPLEMSFSLLRVVSGAFFLVWKYESVRFLMLLRLEDSIAAVGGGGQRILSANYLYIRIIK